LTDNTMINKKGQKASDGRQNATQKTKDIAAWTSLVTKWNKRYKISDM
jgi:hypothetical protein